MRPFPNLQIHYHRQRPAHEPRVSSVFWPLQWLRRTRISAHNIANWKISRTKAKTRERRDQSEKNKMKLRTSMPRVGPFVSATTVIVAPNIFSCCVTVWAIELCIFGQCVVASQFVCHEWWCCRCVVCIKLQYAAIRTKWCEPRSARNRNANTELLSHSAQSIDT